MAKTSLQNLKLGFFVVVGTLLLLLASYLIGNRQNMFTKNFTISAIFKNANGLQNGNNVRFSGINVGTVNSIEMVNDTSIKVFMIIEEKMQKHIKKDAVAMIGSDGLVGSMLVNIVPGEGNASLIEEGDELASYSKIATQDMLSTLNVTNENAALLTADLLEVTQALSNGKGTLGRLLNDTAMANDLLQTISNLNEISAKASKTLTDVNEMLEEVNFQNSVAGVLLSDSLSAGKMQTIISNLDSSSVEINKISQELAIVAKNLRNEDGFVNYLSNDSVMVRQLQNTMQNVEQGTARFNENMEALKHNFLTRGYFRKQERLEKRAAKKKE